mmetsp:Transcript_17717/g.49861  ORF Transcript_17717/g.49861 Transcript_17717/m.49861 type:complete len:1041 (+) Transcript_17717:66-3188(+)|eukprot:CAMPEP_0119132538 /NCGR_PEP_ID=MMETSP1310-20130426/11891_1 /TAXON_ID=464262 /ORGANISM="Genus nov. species nov., Strain RCC2339" /LENGTH=1040 /DNA_ID=CAMNT_0007123175 /DNA_START=29 /DNA_END=3151 /DNA_ORIENTATION=+
MADSGVADTILYETKRAFSMIDRDGSGTITTEELGNLMRAALQQDVTRDEVNRMMNILDTDGNGNISQDEFVRAIAAWLEDDMKNKPYQATGSRKRKREIDGDDRADVHKRIKRFFTQVKSGTTFDEIRQRIEQEADETPSSDINLRLSSDSQRYQNYSSKEKLEALNYVREAMPNFEAMAGAIHSANPYQQVEGVKALAKLLSLVEVFPSASERRTIGDVLIRIYEMLIKCNLAPRLVQLLRSSQSAELQWSVCTCLTYFAPGPRIAGTPVDSPLHPSKMFFKKILVTENIVPTLLEVLLNGSVVDDVRQQAVLCMGVMASDNPEVRDFFLANNCIPVLMRFVNAQASLGLIRGISWTLSILFGNTHPLDKLPVFDLLKPALQKVAEMMVLCDDEEVKCNCCNALRLVLPGVPEPQVLEQVVKLLCERSERVRETALSTIELLVKVDERQYEYLVQHQLLAMLRMLLKESSSEMRKKVIRLLCVIAEKRASVEHLCQSNVVATVVEILSRDESIRLEAVKLLLLLSRGNSSQVEFMVKVGVLKVLGHCLSYFKVYDEVLTNVYSFCGATYDFDFVRDVIGAMQNFLNVGAMHAEESGSLNQIALCFDMSVVDRIFDLLQVIKGTESEELKAWRHHNPGDKTIETSIKNLLHKVYKAHSQNEGDAKSKNICSMISDVWKKHFSESTKIYRSEKVLLKCYYKEEPVSVDEVSPDVSFKEFSRKLEDKYERSVRVTYRGKDGDLTRIDNDVSLHQAFEQVAKSGTLKIYLEDKHRRSSQDLSPPGSPSRPADRDKSWFGSPNRWKGSWNRDEKDGKTKENVSMSDISLDPQPGGGLAALVPTLRADDIDHKNFSLQTDMEHQEQKLQNSLLLKLENSTKYSVEELKSLMDHWAGMAGKLGKLTKDQFAEGMRKLGVSDPLIIDQNFRAFDKDKSGKIDFKEYVIGLSVVQRGSPEERLKLMFDMYDSDGSGSLTFDEVYNIFKAGQVSQGRSAAHDVVLKLANDCMKVADVNNDGEIDFEEFKTAVQRDQILIDCAVLVGSK